MQKLVVRLHAMMLGEVPSVSLEEYEDDEVAAAFVLWPEAAAAARRA